MTYQTVQLVENIEDHHILVLQARLSHPFGVVGQKRGFVCIDIGVQASFQVCQLGWDSVD